MGHSAASCRDRFRGTITDTSFMPRAAIGTGIGTTIAMNISAGLRGGAGSAVLAALIPVAFVLALECLIQMIRRCTWQWYVPAGIPLLGLAGITGTVSWLHGHTVSVWTQNPDLEARLIPFIPDLLIVTGTVALVALKVAAKTAKIREAVAEVQVELDLVRGELDLAAAAGRDHAVAAAMELEKMRDRAVQAENAERRARAELAKISLPAPPAKPRQQRPAKPMSDRALAQLSPDQIAEEERVAGLIRQLGKLPSARSVAADFCAGNRGMADRVMARVVEAVNGATHD